MISSDELLQERQHDAQTGYYFEEHELSERGYIAALGSYVVGGTIATALMALWVYSTATADALVLLFILGIVGPIAGIFTAINSDSWRVSTAGYAMVVIPFGMLCGAILTGFELGSIVRAMLVTGGVVLVMWIVALIIPPIVADFTGLILAGLLMLLIGQLSGFIMAWLGLPGLPADPIMWLGVVLFTGLILFDVNKAMQRTRTLDNAVDSAVGIYLDIINLFVRFLQAFGKRKK